MAGAWEVREVQWCIHFHGPYGNSVVCAAVALDSSDPSGHMCVCWMVSSVERGVTLTPAYGYPFWRRVFTNTAMLPGRPWGLWFVNELLYWLAFSFASSQCLFYFSLHFLFLILCRGEDGVGKGGYYRMLLYVSLKSSGLSSVFSPSSVPSILKPI